MSPLSANTYRQINVGTKGLGFLIEETFKSIYEEYWFLFIQVDVSMMPSIIKEIISLLQS